MHIHRFEKIWIGLSLFLIACFIGIVMFGFVALDLKVPGVEESRTIDPTALDQTEFADPGLRKTEDGYEVYMKSVKFIFLPGSGVPLTVPAGKKITFHITSPDVLHGFQVVGTNINATTIPGQVTTFGTIFPDPGTYGVICNEYCGAAHHTMKAQIEVVPESEIDSTMLVSSAQ